jgi:hypothetical protein
VVNVFYIIGVRVGSCTEKQALIVAEMTAGYVDVLSGHFRIPSVKSESVMSGEIGRVQERLVGAV